MFDYDFSDELIELINKIYNKDFKLFKYKKIFIKNQKNNNRRALWQRQI